MENSKDVQEVIRTHPPDKHRLLWFIQIFTLLLVIAIAVTVALLHINLKERVYRIRHHVANQQQSIIALQTAIQNLTQPGLKKAHALAEVDYLLKLANLHLSTEGNIPVTIQLLKMADQILADLNDPSLLTLRHALANDLAALQIVPKVDLPGIVLKINAISQQIPNLPILPTKTATSVNKTNNLPVPLPWWKRGLEDMRQALQNIVIIRRTGQIREPLLPPEQQIYLTLNIQLKLSQAAWAALHQQSNLYRQTLQQAIFWIQQYYIQNAPATESVLKELTDLQNTVINPAIPDISDSVMALENASSSLTNKPVNSPAGSP